MITGQLTFTIPEIFSLIGLMQCVYVLVYMLFRSGNPARAALPFIYFFVLASAFFLDFAGRFISELTDYYAILQWGLWFYGPPLSVLLIIQIAQINKLPSLINYWVLFLIPVAALVSAGLAKASPDCTGAVTGCEILYDWLSLTGLWAGLLSVMVIWFLRDIMRNLYRQKEGKARYWLILTLVIVNLFFLATVLLSMFPVLAQDDVHMIRSILGIFLVYLAGTSLFRIYPQALILTARMKKYAVMSDQDLELAKRVEKLLTLDKVYHEASYSRSDMARELKIPETILSRIINGHFGRNFPQLMNEYRVEDAKRLLLETSESIKIVAGEAGFNSLASFNRVFRNISGTAPSDFREQNKAKGKA